MSGSALTAVYLGSGLTQAAALFGILVSVIAWTALHNGAPDVFVLGPVICGALMIWPIFRRHASVRVLKRGEPVAGRWTSIERQKVQVNRPRGGGDWLVRATWSFESAGGKNFQGVERMREPNAPKRDEPVSLLFLPAGRGRVVRAAVVHRSLEVEDREVTTTRSTWSLMLLPVLFVLANLIGASV